MKNLKCLVILFTVAVAMFMTACQKDASEELIPERIASEVQEPTAQITVEHISLEELNAVYVANGLEPITLEELGITQEEYDAAQALINNPNIAKPRCGGETALRYLDINNSGLVTTTDVVIAKNVILMRTPWFSPGCNDFARASAIWPRPNDVGGASGPPTRPDQFRLTNWDTVIATRVIIGYYICQ